MGQCSLYGLKNKASVLYLNENLAIPVKSDLCYIFLFAVCFFNYLNWKMKNVHASCFGPLLVVGGVAGTKRTHTHCHENILERFPADYGSEHCLLLDQYFSAYHSSHTFSQRDFSSFFLFLFVFSNGCLIVGISAT